MGPYTFQKIKSMGFTGFISRMFVNSSANYFILFNGKKVRRLKNWSTVYVALVINILNDEFKKRGK